MLQEHARCASQHGDLAPTALCTCARALCLRCRDDAAGEGGGMGRGISFRGDSRWLGLAKAAGQDVLAGVTQSCQLYVAEFECT